MAHYDLDTVKAAARGQWTRIIPAVCGLRASILVRKEGPCPKCGGTERFCVYKDFDETGGARCNQCPNLQGKKCDGFSVVQWARKCDFTEAIRLVAEFLGVKPKETKSKPRSGTANENDPAKDLEFVEWNDALAALWCLKKQPIKPTALHAAGAKMAKYKKQWKVIALPIIGEGGKVVGWSVMNITGGTLPIFKKGSREVQEWTPKPKTLFGSKPGVIGKVSKDSKRIIKSEGVTDMLSALSLPDLPADVDVWTNASGCGEIADKPEYAFLPSILKGRAVYCVHDADEPGQCGATQSVSSDGITKYGWAPCVARHAEETRNVQLPYAIEKTRGKDLRDWITEGHTFADFVSLAETADIVEPAPVQKVDVIDSVDDPHRLARVNLKRYQSEFGRDLKYWREGWYSWKHGQYFQITSDHLKSRIWQSVKIEFDKAWHEEYEAWKNKGDESGKGPPKVRKVTSQLVTNVYGATKSLCSLPPNTKMDSWIGGRETSDWFVSCENGILNLSALMRSNDSDDLSGIVEPHSPNWFSMIKLPYEFDLNAQCPQWQAFVHDVFRGDPDSIEALQKWCGYLLSPDKSLHKIMFVIGQRRSGKGTIARTIRAMLGEANISTPTLSGLSKDFGLEPLIGKTAAMIMDARISARDDEVKVTETLLSISGDDPVDIARKHISSLTGYDLKVRFTLFSNLIPRLRDSSAAFISRCIFLAMPNSYLGREDHELKGKLLAELPGILNWSIAGRFLLNESGKIEQPKLGRSLLEEMKSIMSPVLQFMEEMCVIDPEERVLTKEVFSSWESWCADNEVTYAGSPQSLSRKIKAIDPSIDTKQIRESWGTRDRWYVGLRLKTDEEISVTISVTQGKLNF